MLNLLLLQYSSELSYFSTSRLSRGSSLLSQHKRLVKILSRSWTKWFPKIPSHWNFLVNLWSQYVKRRWRISRTKGEELSLTSDSATKTFELKLEGNSTSEELRDVTQKEKWQMMGTWKHIHGSCQGVCILSVSWLQPGIHVLWISPRQQAWKPSSC